MSPNPVQDGRKMDDALLIKECASPVMPGDKVGALILRAARRLGWSYWRTFNAWYGKVTLSEDERDAARAVMLKNTRNLEALRNEYQRGLHILVSAAERFAAIDPSFSGEEVNRLRDLASGSTAAEDRA